MASQNISNNNLYINPTPIGSLLASTSVDFLDTIMLRIEAKEGSISHLHPKLLKTDLMNKVPHHTEIEFMKLTRGGKMILTTKSITAAQEILQLQSLLSIPVSASVQSESVSTKFLLYNIAPEVQCSDIAEELADAGIVALEIRRFLKKYDNALHPTSTILITKFGTHLPKEIKLWFQLHRISLFVDKPRQCPRCFKFNHNLKACRSPQICKSCGISHEEPCSSAISCANCQGNHMATDKTCPAYLKESRLLRFKSENHLTLSEARRRFKDSEHRTSYARVTADTPPQKFVTKDDLQEALNNFTETMTNLFQQLLDAQIQACQALLQEATCSVVTSFKDLLTPAASRSASQDKSLLPDVPNKRAKTSSKVTSVLQSPMDTSLPQDSSSGKTVVNFSSDASGTVAQLPNST